MRAALTMLLALALGACVTQQHQDVTQAKADYDRCVAAQGETDPDCVALKHHLLAAESRYERNSRRAWACDPAQEQCPTPR